MTHITTASGDWYFIHPTGNDNRANIFPVAVWSQREDGSVIGLIGEVELKTDKPPYLNLVEPPPTKGMYIKRNSVNSAFLDAAIRGQEVDYFTLTRI